MLAQSLTRKTGPVERVGEGMDLLAVGFEVGEDFFGFGGGAVEGGDAIAVPRCFGLVEQVTQAVKFCFQVLF